MIDIGRSSEGGTDGNPGQRRILRSALAAQPAPAAHARARAAARLRSKARRSRSSGTSFSGATRCSTLLEEGLKKRYPGIKFVSWREFGNTHGGERARSARGAAAALQGARGRRGHLRHGVLRELHARRVAGECSVRSGGLPDVVADVRRFLRQAAATSVGLGMPNIPVAMVPGHIGAQEQARSFATTSSTSRSTTSSRISPVMPDATGEAAEPGARDIVVNGGFEEVNRYFFEHEYSDGLPIVPPTRERDRRVPALHRPRSRRESSARCCRTTARRRSGASRSTASWPAAGPSTCRSSSRSSKRWAIRSTASSTAATRRAARR